MENFINETVDTTQLPRFEQVEFSALHANYWKIKMFNLAVIAVVFVAIILFFLLYTDDVKGFEVPIILGMSFIFIMTVVFSRINFVKKGFAFRTHDVLFRNGIISTNTIIIPYNRVQHVALHEGWLSRYFGLATIQIFTAGGSSSDIEIPGIEKEQAENIKQLLMGKIQKQL